MQVNTRWVTGLAQVAHTTPDMARFRLIHEGCFNIAAAGRSCDITSTRLTAI